MLSLSRTAAKRISFPRLTAKRSFSGHGSEAEHAAEVATWKKYSFIMFGVSGFFTVYNIIFHSHDHPRTDLPYMRIRNKPFPWKECPNCNIFDGDCWKECRGGEPAEEHH